MKLKGAYTALITPFKKDGSVDEKALRELVRFQIKSGINGLVPMGTTGESPTLSTESHIRVIEIVVEETDHKVPVIAGTGSNSTQEAVEMTLLAMECGASASLQVAPYYNKPTQEGLYRHFMEIADQADIPHILYNIPGRSGISISVDTVVKLSKHPNIVAVKEASGDLGRVLETANRTGDDFVILSGDDNLILPICCSGGSGVISVASNLFPVQVTELVRLCNENKLAEARVLNNRLFPFFKALFIETNPIPIKYAMAAQKMIEEVYRLPLCEMTDQHKQEMDAVLGPLADFLRRN
ncbi:MAG: 4-hydroxy-tetrahydrodipicolinate synthase [Spirochaetales bacterium]|nr:4-hydroxy-tetrahydrodipicolinate synthase [Spirochaetales bacterium]